MTDHDKNRFIAEALEPLDGKDVWKRNEDLRWQGHDLGDNYVSTSGLWHTDCGDPITPADFEDDPVASYALEQALIAEGFIITMEFDMGGWAVEVARTNESLKVESGAARGKSRLVALRDAAFEALGGEDK